MINIEQSEASDQEEAELMEVESNEDEWEDMEEKEKEKEKREKRGLTPSNSPTLREHVTDKKYLIMWQHNLEQAC